MYRSAPITFTILASTATAALAADYTIPSAETPTLQFALEAPTSPVVNGDTLILTDAGFYLSTYDIQNTNLTIKAAAGQTIVIDGLGLGSVITVSGAGTGLTLEGLTIQGGNAPDGGGIHATETTITIRDCTIRDNSADDDGAGVYLNDATAIIENCTIDSNELNLPNVSDNGAGVHASGSSNVTITNSAFTNNISNNYAGAIYSNNSIYSVNGCIFEGNSALIGGAIGFVSGGSGTISDSIIRFNHAAENGGGVSSVSAWPDFIRCEITDNTADQRGAGIYVTGETSEEVDVTSTLIARNSAVIEGGGFIANAGPDGRLRNCTIVDNSAGNNGGGLINIGGAAGVRVDNCIIRDNTPNQYPTTSSNLAFDCNISDGELANNTRVIDADPMFVDAPNGDYRLLPGSPSIDAGDTSRFGTEMTPLDLDLNMRAVTDPSSSQSGIASLGLYVDHGAYELQINAAPACPADFTNDGVLDVFDVFSFLDAFNIGCP